MNGKTLQVPAWSSSEGPAGTVQQIDDWLGSDAMRTLVESFNAKFPPSLSPPQAADWLEEFAARAWNFRGDGVERDDVERAELTSAQEEGANVAAMRLGLVTERPPARAEYDAFLILGGLIRACLVRARYAADLFRTGVTARELVALGAFRSFSAEERQWAAELQLNADNEFDAMVHSVQRELAWLTAGTPTRIGQRDRLKPSASWEVLTWPSASIPQRAPAVTLSVVAAPSGEPDRRRAHSGETYEYWATHLRRDDTRRVLLITNPIYTVYQGAAAIRSLGIACGLDVETVGVSSGAADLGPITQTWGAQQYLQEIYSSIRALNSLRRDLDAKSI